MLAIRFGGCSHSRHSGRPRRYRGFARRLQSVFTFSLAALTLGAAFVPRLVAEDLSAGTIRGQVLDPSGAAVAGATVEIQNPVSGYMRTVVTDSQGSFTFDNIPFNPYHLAVTAKGFQETSQDVKVNSPVPVELGIKLKIGTAATTVTVTGEAQDLIEQTPVNHTALIADCSTKFRWKAQPRR